MKNMKTFKDNALKPIIAWDFDGTITKENIFPDFAPIRPYAKEVINFLYDIGVITIIWTCRDKDVTVPDYTIHDDITPMENWLKEHGIKYHCINRCIEYAPFHYEARKIYAHMYVDDRAYGWHNREDIMIDVMMQFLHKYVTDNECAITDAIKIICRGNKEADIIEWKERYCPHL